MIITIISPFERPSAATFLLVYFSRRVEFYRLFPSQTEGQVLGPDSSLTAAWWTGREKGREKGGGGREEIAGEGEGLGRIGSTKVWEDEGWQGLAREDGRELSRGPARHNSPKTFICFNQPWNHYVPGGSNSKCQDPAPPTALLYKCETRQIFIVRVLIKNKATNTSRESHNSL